MNCRSCKAELKENEEFCHNCGFDIKADKMKERKKRPKGIKVSIILGAVSLFFAALSLLSVISIYYSYQYDYDRFAIIGLIFSIMFFSITGLIIGIIGFIKARIARKSGYYVTTGSVLSIFGFTIAALELLYVMIRFFILI